MQYVSFCQIKWEVCNIYWSKLTYSLTEPISLYTTKQTSLSKLDIGLLQWANGQDKPKLSFQISLVESSNVLTMVWLNWIFDDI